MVTGTRLDGNPFGAMQTDAFLSGPFRFCEGQYTLFVNLMNCYKPLAGFIDKRLKFGHNYRITILICIINVISK